MIKTPLKFLFINFFILMQPIVNNLNGISMKYLDISILGPVFFALSCIIFILFGISMKIKLRFLSFLTFFIVYFIFMVITDRMDWWDIAEYAKLILPVIIYMVIINLSLTSKKTQKLLKNIMLSCLLYSIINILCAVTGYHYFSYKGFSGFIHNINEFSLLFMIFMFLFSIIKWKLIKTEIIAVVAYILIRSKSSFFILPLFLFRYLKKVNAFAKLLSVLLFVILLKMTVADHVVNFMRIYFKQADDISTFFKAYDSDYIFRNLSFGRSEYAKNLFRLNSKFGDIVFGGGTVMAKETLKENHGGVEMDVLDAFNKFGIFGLIIVGFYYIPVFRLKIPNFSKLIFSVIVLYSIFGGHFMNPLCAVYYGLILGILNNKNKEIIGGFFEIRHDNQYSRSLSRKSS
jgi:hypothetical protein